MTAEAISPGVLMSNLLEASSGALAGFFGSQELKRLKSQALLQIDLESLNFSRMFCKSFAHTIICLNLRH